MENNTKPCPTCGTCPTCGRGPVNLYGQPAQWPVPTIEPWHPYVPIWIAPQPQWINPQPFWTYTTATTAGSVTVTESKV